MNVGKRKCPGDKYGLYCFLGSLLCLETQIFRINIRSAAAGNSKTAFVPFGSIPGDQWADTRELAS